MADDLLLDTHVWLWMALDSPRISPRVRSLFGEAAEENRLHVSAISLLEVATLVRGKRIHLTQPLAAWFTLFFAENDLNLLPLTPDIAVATTRLPPDFHGDPGDRLIAATAMTNNMVLCTHDHALIRFGKQGIYPFLEV